MTVAFQRARSVRTFPVAHLDVRLAIHEHLTDLTMRQHKRVCDAFVEHLESFELVPCGHCRELNERRFLRADKRAHFAGRICPGCVAELDREEDAMANEDWPHCAGGCRECLGG